MAQAISRRSVCRNFRSKKMYTAGGDPSYDELSADSYAHCWCLTTLREFGPDQKICDLTRCLPGRSCFEALVPLREDAE